jgi:Spy/CpxP family protein refolding chaperone
MKNPISKISIFLLTSMLLILAGTALAHDPAHAHHMQVRHHARENQSLPIVDMTMRAIRHLDLSDEQRAGIRTIMQDLKANEGPLKQALKDSHEQLKDLIKAESYDEQAVMTLAEKEGALVAERLVISSRAMSEIYAQLTDEQRAEIETMAAERAARRAENRKQRSANKVEPATT